MISNMGNQQSIAPVYYGFIGCTLSVVSTILGSGIIALPYALRLADSMQTFFWLNVLSVGILLASVKIMLMIRTNVQNGFKFKASEVRTIESDNEFKPSHESNEENEEPQVHVSDLSYLFFGRIGIYLANICIGLGMYAMSTLFYIFFA